jgi:hypothetical protein
VALEIVRGFIFLSLLIVFSDHFDHGCAFCWGMVRFERVLVAPQGIASTDYKYFR